MDNFSIHWNGNGFCCIKNTLNIFLADFAAFNGNDSMAVCTFDVTACNACIYGTDSAANHCLSLFNGLPYGLNGLLNIDDYPFAKTG